MNPTEVQSGAVINALRDLLDDANMKLAVMTARAAQAEQQDQPTESEAS